METPEEIFRKHMIIAEGENCPDDQWKDVKSTSAFKAIMDSMTEYASLKEQEARRQAIHELERSILHEKHVLQNAVDYDYRMVEDCRKVVNHVEKVIARFGIIEDQEKLK